MSTPGIKTAQALYTELLTVLGEAAPARLLTARKASEILVRDGSRITGFVITDKDGRIGIVDKSAVRWLTKEEMWDLMHGGPDRLPGGARPR